MEEELLKMLLKDSYRMCALKAARQLQLPDWWIAAGFVRSMVWDHLHGYQEPTELSDLDVIYFDPMNFSKEKEKDYEAVLSQLDPGYPWSVKNQARMHLSKNEAPYVSVADAMSRWPETATAVGVRLETDGRLSVLAPHGLEDLFGMVIRQSPLFQRRDVFAQRINEKNWLGIWPKVHVVE